MPQVNSHSGSGKTSPEPGAERSNHDEERTRGKGGKDAGRRGRRGDSHGRDSSGDDSTHNCALLEQLKSNKVHPAACDVVLLFEMQSRLDPCALCRRLVSCLCPTFSVQEDGATRHCR